MRAIRPKTRSHAREHIVTIDNDSAPRIMFYGENFMCEDLPVGTRVAGRFQLCIDDTGKPISVAIANSTSIPNYDRTIVARLRAWVFDPIVVDAKPVKVCTMLTVVYEHTKPVEIRRL